jgi:hypothetical protein
VQNIATCLTACFSTQATSAPYRACHNAHHPIYKSHIFLL